MTPIIRMPSHAPEIGTRLLDSGAQGIIVPHVHTAAAARAAVRDYRVPPFGDRADGGGILSGWANIPVKEKLRIVDEQTLLGVMIESVEGLNNIEEIAAVEGVDVIIVGSNDLTIDMGIELNGQDPRLLAAYERIVAAARKNGKSVRLGGDYDPAMVARNIKLGSQLVTVTGDVRVLVNGMRSSLADVKARTVALGIDVD